MTTAAIAAAFHAACRAELDALKPGNVHIHAPGHGMTVADFEASAEAAAPHIAREGASVGERILGAVEATLAAVHQNTNLGIVLLCAPLAAAREAGPGGDLRTSLRAVLDGLTMEDAALVFRAIALANPGGLGGGDGHDVREPPRITLMDAMRLAAPRDRIAHQYATADADIFSLGVPAVVAAAQTCKDDAMIAASIYRRFLTAFPDSHVVRKYGLQQAEKLRADATALEARLAGLKNVAAQQKLLLDFDAQLKASQINPGTSADLTVTALFAQKLQRISE